MFDDRWSLAIGRLSISNIFDKLLLLKQTSHNYLNVTALERNNNNNNVNLMFPDESTDCAYMNVNHSTTHRIWIHMYSRKISHATVTLKYVQCKRAKCCINCWRPLRIPLTRHSFCLSLNLSEWIMTFEYFFDNKLSLVH